jgi:hypothetical protein
MIVVNHLFILSIIKYGFKHGQLVSYHTKHSIHFEYNPVSSLNAS